MHKLQKGRMYNLKEYRIKETVGSYWNRQYEVQEKYTYYDNEVKKQGWFQVFHSRDRSRCEEVLKRLQSK